ncbi:hypothetical protein [Bacillus cereus]|nr:hypothetical protein [Bacillus cereus]
MKFIFSSLHFLAFISLINMNDITEKPIGKELINKRWVAEKIAIWILKIN